MGFLCGSPPCRLHFQQDGINNLHMAVADQADAEKRDNAGQVRKQEKESNGQRKHSKRILQIRHTEQERKFHIQTFFPVKMDEKRRKHIKKHGYEQKSKYHNCEAQDVQKEMTWINENQININDHSDERQYSSEQI